MLAAGGRRPIGARRPALRVAAIIAFAVLLVGATACEPPPPPPPPSFPQTPVPVGCDVGLLGDSLTVRTAEYLPDALRRRDCTLAWWDGVVGRKTGEGVEALRTRSRTELLPAILVVGLGTNDRFYQGDFAGHIDAVMQLATGRPVVWVEIAYDPIKANMNRILRAKAAQYRNLSIMEWDEEYWENPTWRATDDVHATPLGYEARAAMTAIAAQKVAK